MSIPSCPEWKIEALFGLIPWKNAEAAAEEEEKQLELNKVALLF